MRWGDKILGWGEDGKISVTYGRPAVENRTWLLPVIGVREGFRRAVKSVYHVKLVTTSVFCHTIFCVKCFTCRLNFDRISAIFTWKCNPFFPNQNTANKDKPLMFSKSSVMDFLWLEKLLLFFLLSRESYFLAWKFTNNTAVTHLTSPNFAVLWGVAVVLDPRLLRFAKSFTDYEQKKRIKA